MITMPWRDELIVVHPPPEVDRKSRHAAALAQDVAKLNPPARHLHTKYYPCGGQDHKRQDATGDRTLQRLVFAGSETETRN